VNAPRNFFKHADNDPEGTLKFHEVSNGHLMLDACAVLRQFPESPLVEATVFLAWFGLAEPQMRNALPEEVRNFLEDRNDLGAEDFPRFRNLCNRVEAIARDV